MDSDDSGDVVQNSPDVSKSDDDTDDYDPGKNFSIMLNREYVKHGQLRLPYKIATDHNLFDYEDCTIEFTKHADRREFKLIPFFEITKPGDSINKPPSTMVITGDWRGFKRSNGLQYGSLLRFTLLLVATNTGHRLVFNVKEL